MDSLQRQMEEHTITVHESMSSWSQVEGQLKHLNASTFPAAELGDQDLLAVDQKDHNCNASEKELAQ